MYVAQNKEISSKNKFSNVYLNTLRKCTLCIGSDNQCEKVVKYVGLCVFTYMLRVDGFNRFFFFISELTIASFVNFF